jgi:hypothetical protein
MLMMYAVAVSASTSYRIDVASMKPVDARGTRGDSARRIRLVS